MITAESRTAAAAANLGDRFRAAIAPATINSEANKTMSCPAPNLDGNTKLPTVPPMALARPPPSTDVVSHGSQVLPDSNAAKSVTNQPGRSDMPRL